MKRILLSTLGLLLLAIGGVIVLFITASRVGEHKSSTFGHAYSSFQDSWGGEVEIAPPEFTLQHEEFALVDPTNKDEMTFKQVVIDVPLHPSEVKLHAYLKYEEQEHDWISFNAYEATLSDRYCIINETPDTGQLLLTLYKPDNARVINDIKILVGGLRIVDVPLGKPQSIIKTFAPGDTAVIAFSFKTKGVDDFNYNIGKYGDHVTPKLTASLNTNTSHYNVSNFGLPHATLNKGAYEQIDFELRHFSTEQQIGLSFYNRIMHLEKMENMMFYSPISLVLFLMVIFFYSQIHNKNFSGLHYFFIAVIHLFYFLFIAYLIRFFGIWISIDISSTLTAIMALLYFPKVFGRTFFLKIILPYLTSLTIVFTLIFLLPMLQGISFLVLVFLILVTLMLAITHSQISEWPIVASK